MTDITVDELIGAAEEVEQGDIAVAIRDIERAVAETYPDDDAMDKAIDQVTLPFHDAEREAAFALGMTFGAWLEKRYPDRDADDADVARGE